MSDIQTEYIDNGLVISREFNAPRELVFRAYAEADLIKRWWGPEGFPVTKSTMDFRAGGEWLYCMRSEESGDEFWSKANYEEIVPPEKIVWTDAFADSEGNVNPNLPTSHSIITFAESNGVTTLRNEARYESDDARDQVVKMGMLEGVSICFKQLDALLAELKDA